MEILNYITPLLALALGYLTKGMYEKKKAKAKTQLYEIDSHSELYEKLEKQFYQLNNKLFEYQRKVTELTSENQKLSEVVASLQKSVEDLTKEVHASNERAELYRKALKEK